LPAIIHFVGVFMEFKIQKTSSAKQSDSEESVIHAILEESILESRDFM
jgi:hypothetical protein